MYWSFEYFFSRMEIEEFNSFWLEINGRWDLQNHRDKHPCKHEEYSTDKKSIWWFKKHILTKSDFSSYIHVRYIQLA
jgi:hypothetical protein